MGNGILYMDRLEITTLQVMDEVGDKLDVGLTSYQLSAETHKRWSLCLFLLPPKSVLHAV